MFLRQTFLERLTLMIFSIFPVLVGDFLNETNGLTTNCKWIGQWKGKAYPLPESFSGQLKQNDILSKSIKLFENQIEGPESIAIFNGTIFTGSRNGYIYKINTINETLIPVIKLIDGECQTWNQSLCSRPLGMRFDSKGVLYVIEPFFGLFQVINIMTSEPQFELILNYSQTETLGKKSKLFDDLVIDENSGLNGGHVFYITDLSTEFDLTQITIAVTSSQSGRILRYDRNANKLEIILDNILCPNGIELSDDKLFLLFAETTSRRIIKHYIRGPNKGQTSCLISSLPGEPDNIRKTKRNTYWIALAFARCQQNPHLIDWLDDKPLIKKLAFRSAHLTGSVIQSFGHFLNIDWITNFGFQMKTGLNDLFVGTFLAHSYGMAIEINDSGDIIRSLHSPDGTISLLSEVNQFEEQNNTVLYFGSAYNKYFAKLILI